MIKNPTWDDPHKPAMIIADSMEKLYEPVTTGDKTYGRHHDHKVEIIVTKILDGAVIGLANIVQPPAESIGEITCGDLVLLPNSKREGTTKT